MDNEKMMPGRYNGTIVKCDSGAVGANKTPLVKLFFKLETGLVVPWTGWFSDKVNQRTGKTYTELVIEKLVECGFTGKCVSEMSDPKIKINTLFNTVKEWSLEIDYQEDKNGVKTEYFEVKFINDPDKQGTTKLDHAESVEVFKGMNLSGIIAQAKSKNKPAATKQQKPAAQPVKTEEFEAGDIPF